MANTKRHNKIKKNKKRVSRKLYGGYSSQINKSAQKYNPISNYNNLQNQMTNKINNSIPNINNLQNQMSDKLTNSLPDYNKLQNQMSDKINNSLPDYNKLQNQMSDKLTNSIPNINNLQNQMSDKLTKSIPNYNSLKEQISVPDEQNVLSQLMSVGAQLANKGINFGVSSIANLTGTDPNLSAEESINTLKNKAQNIANVISNTDLGNQLGQELSQATEKILGPSVEKGSDILNQLAQKEEKAVVGLGANLAEDVAYPIVAPIRTALSGLQVVENATEAASEATGVLKEQVEAYNDVKEKIGQTLEEISDIASKNIIPETTNLNQPLEQMTNNLPNPINPINQFSEKNDLQEQSLKNINKEGTMVGGRILSSQLEFLGSYPKTLKKRRVKRGRKSKRNL
jgi:hypothetical protein